MTVEQVPTSGFNVPQAGAAPAPANTPSPSPEPAPIPAVQPLPQPIPAQPVPAPAPAQNPIAQPELEPIAGVPTAGLRDFDVNQIDDPLIKTTAEVLLATSPDLDLDRALGKALMYGKSDLIDEAYLREKGGKDGERLVKLANAIVTQVSAKAEATTNEIYSLAGGEPAWIQAATVFNTTAPQETREAIAEMLDSGNAKWIKYAATQIMAFAKASGSIPVNNPLITTGGAVAASAQALSKTQFQAENNKLDRNAPDYNEKYNALVARRQLGRQLGL